ncbi:hypothetical protein IKG06_01100 [Candidatus Saccharibacteria bacterium]|nr:hypothetical protein [Candidatus Saccharibacteria bacterium]
MMGQNSFSNAVGVAASEQKPIDFAPVDQASSFNKPNTKKIKPKTIILILIAMLIGAGVTTVIFLLFINRTVEEPSISDVIETESPENDGTKTAEQVIEEFNNAISNATDESDKLDLMLNEVDYYILEDDYDSALAALGKITIDTLTSSNKQNVYNRYSTVYEGKGDSEQAAHYKQLAEQAFNQAYQGQQDVEIEIESSEGGQAEDESSNSGEEE